MAKQGLYWAGTVRFSYGAAVKQPYSVVSASKRDGDHLVRVFVQRGISCTVVAGAYTAEKEVWYLLSLRMEQDLVSSGRGVGSGSVLLPIAVQYEYPSPGADGNPFRFYATALRKFAQRVNHVEHPLFLINSAEWWMQTMVESGQTVTEDSDLFVISRQLDRMRSLTFSSVLSFPAVL